MEFIIMWAVLLVLFIIIEIVTSGLTSIWLALGAAGALISAAVAPQPELLLLQIAIFLVISGVSLYFTRPLVKKYAKVRETPTNANRALEMIGIVRETVHNIDGKGTVYVDGKLWTARSETDEPIEVDTQVDILRIEGVKLIVRPHVVAEAAPAVEEQNTEEHTHV
ncbi:MAG: NfeD family protein [Oscillospiraceae bacterium]|nr:NfeD family protein [Oscillospiraceae bacterium]